MAVLTFPRRGVSRSASSATLGGKGLVGKPLWVVLNPTQKTIETFHMLHLRFGVLSL